MCIVRGVLGLCNALALISFGRSVQRVFGSTAAIWYALFQASQFHVIYYVSRTLPNMFAFVFSKLPSQTTRHPSILSTNHKNQVTSPSAPS